MFETCLLESTHRNHARTRWSFAVSIGIQAALATAIVTLPLLHPERLTRLALAPPLLIAPVPAPPLPPPAPVRVVATHADTAAAPATAAPTQFVKATFHSIVDTIMKGSSIPDAPPGVTPTNAMGVSGPNLLPAGIGPATGRPVVGVAGPARPTRVSGGISAGLLLAPITPLYPAIAKATRTEGTVIIHAIISKTGEIESANVVSGPAMLQDAALDAVRRAHYRPYLLSGEPTEVETTININFRMTS